MSESHNGFYFRKLDVYSNSKLFAVFIYKLLEKFPIEERFGLCTQMRRDSTSIAINIAEGWGRSTCKEKTRFIDIAHGSLNETLCELEISLEMGYITKDDFTMAETQLTIIAKQLSSLKKSIIRNSTERQ